MAILSPIALANASSAYGALETVASNITEGLVARGWDVTLFASKNSVTRGRLHAVVNKGYEEYPAFDPKVAEYLSHFPKRPSVRLSLTSSATTTTSWL